MKNNFDNEKMHNNDNKETKISKTLIKANIFNGIVLFLATFAQLSMIKIIRETQSEYAPVTYIIFALILILGILNFKLQNEKTFIILNFALAAFFAINLYIFLSKIIGCF